MQLDQITANIRLRSPWEAIDLGIALIRHSWRDIYLPWFIILSAISTLLFLITPADYREYSLFAVWWLKPLFDRFLLNMVSKQLFNEHLSTIDSLTAVPELIKNTGLLSGLTFRRPSFSRGFNLPIWQLERLKGKARAERQHTLLQSAHTHAIGLTTAMIFIELAIYFSLYALIVAFLPETFQGTAVGLFISNDLGEEVSTWLHALDHLIYTLSVFLIEPFFVATSFSLYINRRTQLEAWDIELVFRQLTKRLKELGNKASSLVLILIPLVIVLVLSSEPVYAEDSNPDLPNSTEIAPEYLSDHRLEVENSSDIIDKIMQRDELSNEKKVKKWVEIDKEKNKKEESDDDNWNLAKFLRPLVKLLSMLFESSLWVGLGIAVIALFLSRHKWLPLFTRGKHESIDYEAPEVMFGMDIRPESLPENISQAARELWHENKHRESLSLLYRGALAHLVAKEELLLKPSQTEGDILKLAQQNLATNKHIYLAHLTKQWEQIAYAHQLPEVQQVTLLFDRWQQDFIIQEQIDTYQKSTIEKNTKAGVKHEE